jgi:hypothetical protein
MNKTIAHELDAVDLAAIWPLSGQPSLAPVHSAADRQLISKRAITSARKEQ